MIELRELLELGEVHRRQALDCIHRTVEVSNSPDYSKSVIDYLIRGHYTAEWQERKMGSGFFVVALLDGVVVGTGLLEEGEIKAVFVNPDHQRKGMGKTVMEALERKARTMGLCEVVLNSSITARKFYEAFGYSLVKENRDEVQGDVLITYYMKKSL